MAFEAENTQEERTVAGIQFILNILFIIIGVSLIFRNRLDTNTPLILAFTVYSIAMFFTLPIATLVDINTSIKWFYSLLWNPKLSLLYQLYIRDKKNTILKFLWRINSNFLLALSFWHAFFAIFVFIGSLFAPQSAIGLFVGTYVFPVRPQNVFLNLGIDLKALFFIVFPSNPETSVLVTAISMTQSILDSFVLTFLNRITFLTISLLFVSLLAGFYWQWIHTLVSGGREFDKIGHFVFGMNSGILTIFTGIWIPAWAYHNNNLFYWFLAQQPFNELFRLGLFSTVAIVLAAILIISFTLSRKKK